MCIVQPIPNKVVFTDEERDNGKFKNQRRRASKWQGWEILCGACEWDDDSDVDVSWQIFRNQL